MQIFIHHSAIAGTKEQFNRINAYHKQKWNSISSLGFYGGYTYLLEKSGKVLQYRAVGEETIAQKGYNSGNPAICFAGNFETEDPTQSQKRAFAELVGKLGGGRGQIRLHKDVSATLCPGKNLISYIEEFKSIKKDEPPVTMRSISDAIELIRQKVAALFRQLGLAFA
ncbi:MAG TPA: N-acetylmuramoyl-L-alanine amidase [bacterium]|nr:N-acetylmuramoyl-L-alanine amidase [bacterium]